MTRKKIVLGKKEISFNKMAFSMAREKQELNKTLIGSFFN